VKQQLVAVALGISIAVAVDFASVSVFCFDFVFFFLGVFASAVLFLFWDLTFSREKETTHKNTYLCIYRVPEQYQELDNSGMFALVLWLFLLVCGPLAFSTTKEINSKM